MRMSKNLVQRLISKFGCQNNYFFTEVAGYLRASSFYDSKGAESALYRSLISSIEGNSAYFGIMKSRGSSEVEVYYISPQGEYQGIYSVNKGKVIGGPFKEKFASYNDVPLMPSVRDLWLRRSFVVAHDSKLAA